MNPALGWAVTPDSLRPMRHPPGCDCGCGNGDDQVEWLRRLIDQRVNQILDQRSGPIKTGPILGVVDGSDARQGEIGEYVRGQAALTITAAGDQAPTVTPLVVPPGDWDLEGSAVVQQMGTDGIWFGLTPLPVGMIDDLFGWMPNIQPPVTQWGGWVNTARARASFTVPTALLFTVNITAATPIAGQTATVTILVTGRRMR
jgi:hypothetical protein